MGRLTWSTLIGVLAVGIAVTAAAADGNVALSARLNTTPIIYGYPWASECPVAGLAKRVDRFGMYACNCTSYVAWALHANGLSTDWFIPGAMDAWNWPHVAGLARLHVAASPSVGAVAVWPHLGGRLGHVAFVTQVSPDARFSVAEYNLPSRSGATHFEFDVRSNLSPAGVQFIVVPADRG